MNKPVNKDGTVGKALEILDLVAGLGVRCGLRELLSLSPHLPKATLYRFCADADAESRHADYDDGPADL